MVGEVVRKLCEDRGFGILVAPRTPEALWWLLLEQITVTYWDLPSDVSLLMRENGTVMADSFQLRACVVDGSLCVERPVLEALDGDGVFSVLDSCGAAEVVRLCSVEARGEQFLDLPFVCNAVTEIQQRFSDVFGPIPAGDPPVRGACGEHTIDLKPGARPRCKRPYHLPPDRESALVELVSELLERK